LSYYKKRGYRRFNE